MGQTSFIRLLAASGVAGLLAACAPPPPPEPPMLSPTPSFNKMGQLVSCGAGYSVRGNECVPYDRPDEPGCIDATGAPSDCEPGRDDQPGRDPDDPTGMPDPQ